ncbi:MAG TPA: serine/threonine-protein kinase [Archangium sp.]|uniref:serine/threonine-protein kinase n=1 Tax=Archangium sp. TaxID=1872627 RepID=UPI002ED9F384
MPEDVRAPPPVPSLGPDASTPTTGVATRTAPPALSPLANRYIVLDVLGQGGMGTVTAAYDTRLDRRVALKLLHPRADQEGAQQQIRMLREAQAMARLSHPNVVAVYDAGTLEDGTVFISMELVEGQTLRHWCLAHERPWREVLAVYLEAGRGLAAAHAAGLVHRDFKPENVLVGKDGRARVTDFGLARIGDPPSYAQGPEMEEPHLAQGLESETGMLMGTPRYMAPEVMLGQPVDARSDLFSFCVALYEALYRQPAFPGDTVPARWEAQRTGRINPPPAQSPVPAWMASRVLRGLQLAPEQRPPSLQALISDLEDDPDSRRRARLRVAGLIAGVTSLVVLALAGWMHGYTRDCGNLEQRLVSVWDMPLQAGVRRALLDTGLSYAPSTAERVQTVLDGYAREWLRLRTEVCEASPEGVGQSQDLALLQVSCLERRRSQFGALVKLLARGPDKQLLPQAVQIAQSLPTLGSCMDAQTLTSAVPLPQEPTARARIESLQHEVDHLETLWLAGKFSEGLELGARLLPQVEALDYAPLRAQLLYHLGRLHGGLGDYARTDALLRQALTQAARGKDDVLMARLWNMIIWNAEVRLSHPLEGLDAEQVVLETTAERAGDDLARAESLHSLGGVLYKVGRFDEALARFQQAQVLMEKALGPEHAFVAAMYNNVGVTLMELGRYEEARTSYERALAIAQKTLGPEHPDVANTLTSLGRSLVRAQHLDEAEHHLQNSLAIGEKVLGPEHPQVAETLLGLAEVALARGQPAQALPPLERALSMDTSFERAEFQFTLARALEASGGALERARQLATEALEHYRRIGNQPKGTEVSQWLATHFGATSDSDSTSKHR